MARNKSQIGEKYNAPFPTALRKLMDERGDTQENIARTVGKTRQTVSQYVNGISEPSYEILVKIANHYNVSTDYLLGLTKDSSRQPCAADDLGLSPTVINMLRSVTISEYPEILDGLNLLIEKGRLFDLAADIKRFCDMVDESIEISKQFEKNASRHNVSDEDYYKWSQAWEEGLLETSFCSLIETEHPEFKGKIRVLLGRNIVENEKRSIEDFFDDMLRSVSGYSEFRSRTVKDRDIVQLLW